MTAEPSTAQSSTIGAPTTPRRTTSTRDPVRFFARRLGVITVFAFAVRVANVLWWRPTTDIHSYHNGYYLWGDAYYYHWQANALAKGYWFVDPFRFSIFGSTHRPSSVHPPLYTIYLSMWSWLGLDTVTWHRLASCVLGAAAVLVIGIVGYRIAGTAVGLLAAGIAAVYPQLWINDGMLLSEPMAVLTAAVVILVAYEFWRRPSMRWAVLLGLACALATASRSELSLLFPLLVIPLALLAKGPDRKRRLQMAGAACVAGGLLLLPWVTFNLLRFEEFSTMNTGFGAALSAASCDETYYGDRIGYYADCFQGPWPPPSYDESESDAVARKDAMKYIKAHLGRLPVVAAARVGRLWDLYMPGDTTRLDYALEGRGRAASWIGLFSYYLLAPFAVVGLVVLRRRRVPLLPLMAFIVIATIAAALFFGNTRYRAPAEVSVVLAAATGMVAAWHRLADRRSDPVASA
ncbi:MAG: glycosyltransferase family 39 protein [Acidimicrobiia bacterium]